MSQEMPQGPGSGDSQPDPHAFQANDAAPEGAPSERPKLSLAGDEPAGAVDENALGSPKPADLEGYEPLAPLPSRGAGEEVGKRSFPGPDPLLTGGSQTGMSPRHQLEAWLDQMVRRRASDLILRAGARPACRVDGRIELLEGRVPGAGPMLEVLEGVVGLERMVAWRDSGSVDAGLNFDGLGRFRLNAYRQMGEPAIVLRRISDRAPELDQLCLPTAQLSKIALRKRGIVLVTGIAGSGKSTTLAAMIQHMNRTAERHVVTLEDPVELLFHEDRCVISQREIGTDVPNFSEGLRHALRQSPDVILIGEMRDAETVQAALDATETGHLVMSTLHTVNASQTMERVISFFPAERHSQIRARLADNLACVLSQRLLPRAGGEGMVPAVELLLDSPMVRELIAEGKAAQLSAALDSTSNEAAGMSFNQSLLKLVEAGLVDLDTACAASDKPDELKLSLRGFASQGRRQTPRMGGSMASGGYLDTRG
jgi:twitching motility protein PilT